MEDFNSLIQKLALRNANKVYLYKFGMEMYYVIRGMDSDILQGRDDRNSFPPDDIEDYLQRREMVPLGSVKEILER